MAVLRRISIVVYLLLVSGQEVGVDCTNGTVCVPKQINAHIAFANIDQKQFKIVEKLVKTITDRQADGSTFSLSLVGEDYIPIGQFMVPVSPDTIQSNVSSIQNYAKERKVSVHALIQASLAAFPYKKYGTVTEILILIVGSTTVLPDKPETVAKKKTFLIGIGEPVKKNFSGMATREDHLFWLNTTGDLSGVYAAISNQICEDSKYLCDVDMYEPATSGGGRASCKKCSELESGTSNVCPYYISNHSAENNTVVPPPGKDTYKKIAIIAVTVGIAIVIVVGIGVSCFFCIRKAKQHYQYVRQTWFEQGLLT